MRSDFNRHYAQRTEAGKMSIINNHRLRQISVKTIESWRFLKNEKQSYVYNRKIKLTLAGNAWCENLVLVMFSI